MPTFLCLAFKRKARTACLGQTVDIICFDAERIFDILSHILCPGLCIENACFKVNIIGSNTLFIHKAAAIFNILVNVLNLFYEFFVLYCPYFFNRSGFDFG